MLFLICLSLWVVFLLCFIVRFGTLNELLSVTINASFFPLFDINHLCFGLFKISAAFGPNHYSVNFTSVIKVSLWKLLDVRSLLFGETEVILSYSSTRYWSFYSCNSPRTSGFKDRKVSQRQKPSGRRWSLVRFSLCLICKSNNSRVGKLIFLYTG